LPTTTRAITDYLYQALISPMPPDREDNWGKLFQTSGGIRQPASV
jgi:hypothetical protein